MLGIRQLSQVVRGVVVRLESEFVLCDLLRSLRSAIERPTVSTLAAIAVPSFSEPPADAHTAKTNAALALGAWPLAHHRRATFGNGQKWGPDRRQISRWTPEVIYQERRR